MGWYGGIMSGTSLDAVDACLVSFSGPCPQLRAHCSLALAPELRQELLALNQPQGMDELHRAALAAQWLMQDYAQALGECLRQAALQPRQVQALGAHGQTLRHRPDLGYTLQLNNGALLAELTKVTVVTDFRTRDVAAGGQGAPLVPAFHEALFRSPTIPRVILNLGGIANVTLLVPGQPTRGYDTGPGNLLMDAWAQRHLGQPYDARGAWGQRGQVRQDVLARLLAHPFFAQAAPKSAGRDGFNLPWLESHLSNWPNHPGVQAPCPTPLEVQATLQEFSAQSIAQALLQEDLPPFELWVCGGGVHNIALMARLQALLPQAQVGSTETLGLHPQWVEAVAFAWLARELMQGRPGNLPAVTGARHTVPLGAIYPAGSD